MAVMALPQIFSLYSLGASIQDKSHLLNLQMIFLDIFYLSDSSFSWFSLFWPLFWPVDFMIFEVRILGRWRSKSKIRHQRTLENIKRNMPEKKTLGFSQIWGYNAGEAEIRGQNIALGLWCQMTSKFQKIIYSTRLIFGKNFILFRTTILNLWSKMLKTAYVVSLPLWALPRVIIANLKSNFVNW